MKKKLAIILGLIIGGLAFFYILGSLKANEINRTLAELEGCGSSATADTYECIEQVFAQARDPYVCRKVNLFAMPTCFNQIAKAKQDTAVCDQIQQIEIPIEQPSPQTVRENIRAECYMHVAAAKKDTAVCDRLTGEHKDACYNAVAQATGNASICKSTANPDDCYRLTAYTAKDYTICENITKPSTRDNCYTFYTKKPDKRACEKVQDVTQQNFCFELSEENSN